MLVSDFAYAFQTNFTQAVVADNIVIEQDNVPVGMAF